MIIRSLPVIVAIILGSCSAHAQGQPSVGRIYSVEGSGTIDRAGAELRVESDLVVLPGDVVRVGDPGRIAIALNDGSYLRLRPGSTVRFTSDEQLEVKVGDMHFFAHASDHPAIVTPHVSAAIRGTEFTIEVKDSSTRIAMISGQLDGSSDSGKISISTGTAALFRPGHPPETERLLATADSVQWGAFVPLVESYHDYFPSGRDGGTDKSLTDALASLSQGQTARALDLTRSPPGDCTLRSVLRARIVITSGDLDGGTNDLDNCIRTTQNPSVRALASATRGLVSIGQGRLKEAKIESAGLSAATIPSARFLSSFIRQSEGDLEGALAALAGADKIAPELRARRAELLFAMGRVPEARKILEGLTDRSWYSESILGFVLMADRSFDEAALAFARANNLAPASGLPHLGLGIIEVNRGDLPAARLRFERAAHLEPTRSTFRSYIAKAYFESDTYEPAESEFQNALSLDPNDPTPYLYRSFMRLAQNSPVAALRDLERATELSDYRNVYRSSLLLDEDTAVQSASLGRVYRELGFGERGKIEAIRSLEYDYENAAAHRLLSETRRRVLDDRAALSERRIANLFAPVSINVVDSINPSISLGEYSALFERGGWRTSLGSSFDSADDIWSQSILMANKTGNVATGLAASGTIASGLGEPPALTRDGEIGMSVHVQPSWADKFVFEGRGRGVDQDERNEDFNFEEGSGSGAYIHRFGPGTTAVVQSKFSRNREKFRRPEDELFLIIDEIFEGEITSEELTVFSEDRFTSYDSTLVNEGQLLHTSGALTSIFTLRHFNSERDESDDVRIPSEDPSAPDTRIGSQAAVNLSGGGASYLAKFKATDWLHVDLGGGFESVEWESRPLPPFSSDTESDSRWTPRAGVILLPGENAILRAGYSEQIGTSTLQDIERLEPTHIGGISQRFSDLPGTRARTLGSGADFKPLSSTYTGIEWTRRWLDESETNAAYRFTIDVDNETFETDTLSNERTDVTRDQDFLSTYLYQILSERAVAGAEYRFAREEIGFPDGRELDDHAAKLFSRYFFENGLFAQGTGTYRYQDRREDAAAAKQTDGGWLFGAGLGYRLPNRHGLILAEVRNIFSNDIDLEQVSGLSELSTNDTTMLLRAEVNF